MNIEFENEFIVIVGLIIGLIFVLRIICGFITRLVELRVSRRILNELYTFTDKVFNRLISYSNGYDFKEDEKEDI